MVRNVLLRDDKVEFSIKFKLLSKIAKIFNLGINAKFDIYKYYVYLNCK